MEKEDRNLSLKHQLLSGLIWGFFMFVIMELVIPYFDKKEITTINLLIAVPFWGILGLIYGYVMLLVHRRKEKRKK